MDGTATSRTRITAISGSLRRQSLNTRLLEAARTIAPRGLDVEIYVGLAELPMFNEDLEDAAFAGGPVRALVDQVKRSGALLIATPEYNHSMPGVLKNAIDWLSRPGANAALEGLPVAIVGATSGRWGTRLAQAALRQTLIACEVALVPAPMLFIASAHDAFRTDGSLADQGAEASLEKILGALMTAAAPAFDTAAPPRPAHPVLS